MMKGTVTAELEAVMVFDVSGPGTWREPVTAIIDTGFTGYLTLPESLVARLALPHILTDRVVLADGTVAEVEAYECAITWGERSRDVIAHCTGVTPLIGMALLRDHLLGVEVTPAGQVTIEDLP
jgi:clan AA aspartic protease